MIHPQSEIKRIVFTFNSDWDIWVMKKGIIMAGFVAFLMGLLGSCKDKTSEYKIADVYRGLRQQVFNIDPSKIGIAPTATNRVWGMLMETGYSEAVVTLVTIADGTVSLYFSNGGGIIGVGQHEGPRKACESFLATASMFVNQAQQAKNFPLPKVGNTRFYFLTFDGVFTVEAKETDLGNNKLSLSPLFHTAHKVIAEARIVDEKRRAAQQ